MLGLEYYNEDTAWLRWDTENRRRLAKIEDRDFHITTLSLFAQGEWELSPHFRPSLGVRYDGFGGDYQNRDPESVPTDVDMNDYDYWSPKLGFRSLIAEGLDFRASYSEGFALPDGEAKYQTDLAVSPEVVKQYEIGLSYQPSERVSFDVSGFILDTSDEIQETPIDSGNYENLGKTRRTGVEAAVSVKPVEGLTLFGDVTLIQSEILTSSDPTLDGKEITSVPRHVLNLGGRVPRASGDRRSRQVASGRQVLHRRRQHPEL